LGGTLETFENWRGSRPIKRGRGEPYRQVREMDLENPSNSRTHLKRIEDMKRVGEGISNIGGHTRRKSLQQLRKEKKSGMRCTKGDSKRGRGNGTVVISREGANGGEGGVLC